MNLAFWLLVPGKIKIWDKGGGFHVVMASGELQNCFYRVLFKRDERELLFRMSMHFIFGRLQLKFNLQILSGSNNLRDKNQNFKI